MPDKEKELKPFQLGLTGKLVSSVDPTRLTFEQAEKPAIDNFKTLKNLRPTDNGIRGIQGMSKINSTALSTQLKSRNIHQYLKSQPAENHVLVQAFDTNEDNSKVWRNDISIPNTGDFNGTELHTDARTTGSITAFAANGTRTTVTSVAHGRLNGDTIVQTGTTSYNAVYIVNDVTTDTYVIPATFVANDATGTWATHTKGRMENCQLGRALYCNGAETMVWGGDRAALSSFEVFDEFADTFTFDYAEKVRNTLTDTANVAAFKQDGDTPVKVSLRISNILPVEGFDFKVSTANATTSAASVFYWDGSAWAAVSSQTDNTSSGGITMAQSGTITFTSTATTAKQSVVNGVLGYYYKIEMPSADEATRISNVTVIEPFQKLQDFWDGIPRTVSSVQLFEDSIFKDNTVNVFEDEFVFDEASEGDLSTYMVMSELETSTEYLAVGFRERMQGLQIKMIPNNSNQDVAATGTLVYNAGDVTHGDVVTVFTVDGVSIITGSITSGADAEPQMTKLTVDSINNKTSSPNYTASSEDGVITVEAVTRGTGENGNVLALTVGTGPLLFKLTNMANGLDIAAALTVKYWNGSAWTSVGTVTDGTSSDSASFGKSGFITWNPIAENTEFKRELNSEDPLYYYQLSWDAKFSPDTLCYHITGIPVQKQIDNYSFPLNAQNRTWLMDNTSDKRNTGKVTALETLSAFNGEDSKTFTFGDETPVTAGLELFTELTTGAISDVLIAKNNSLFRITGSNPEDWVVTQISTDVGCPAPYTFKASPVGLEFSALQTKQVAVWQSENGIMMYDSKSVFPISDSISNYFDQTKSESINLNKLADSYGFWNNSNGVYEYHWLFASGTSTTLDKELIFDLRRQKWWEADRESGNRLQCGVNVVSTNGAHYNYAMIDSGFMERLEDGTAWTGDGSAIAYEFELGDLLPAKGDLNLETLIRNIKLVMVPKNTTSSTVTVTHHDDTNQTGKTITLSPAKSGYDATMPIHSTSGYKWGKAVFHRLKFTISTDDETIGFEPLWVGGFYEEGRKRLKD